MQPLVSLPTLGSRDHITPAMKELHWLPINQRITIIQAVSNDAFHSHTAYLEYMRDLVSMTATTATRTGLRSASGLSYWKPRIRTKFVERAFSYSGSAAWNSLPIHLQTTSLLTLTLSSVYLKLTYLLPLINCLIAFVVHVSMTVKCPLDYCVSGHTILLYLCMYVCSC